MSGSQEVSCTFRLLHSPSYRFEAAGRRVVLASALKRDAGVTLLADRRLAKPVIVCSHSSGDRFRRFRIGGASLATDPRFPGFN